MAATVRRNRLEGHAAEVTAQGWTFTEAIYLENVRGTGVQQLINAVNAPGVPHWGDLHAQVPTAVVMRVVPEVQSGGTVRLLVTYEDQGRRDDPADQDVEIGTSLQSVQTNVDITGTLMKAEFLQGSEWKIQGGQAAVMRPHSTIRVTRTEANSPGQKSREYVGKVNGAGQFNLARHGVPKRTWLCTSILGRRNPDNNSYRVSYEFEYAATYTGFRSESVPGWDAEIVYTDPDNGKVPEDVINRPHVQVRAVKYYQVYTEANFNALNLGR